MECGHLASLEELLRHEDSGLVGEEAVAALLAFLRDYCIVGDSAHDCIDYRVGLRAAYAEWRAGCGAGVPGAWPELPPSNGRLAPQVKRLVERALRTPMSAQISHAHHGRVRSVYRGWRLRSSDPLVSEVQQQQPLPLTMERTEEYHELPDQPSDGSGASSRHPY